MAQIFHSLSDLKEAFRQSPFMATIGLFDGVHKGHQSLIRSTVEKAKGKGFKSLIITLDTPPRLLLNKAGTPPYLLSSLKRKLQLIESFNPDGIYLLHFTEEVASLTPEAFITPFIQEGLREMVLGYDNRFGQRIKEVIETTEFFDQRLRNLGLGVERAERIFVSEMPVSSSQIRSFIQERRFDEARLFLGRTFSFLGDVVSGKQIGRTINYPTANIVPQEKSIMIPPPGIYVSEVRVGERCYPAMSYYGTCPTIITDKTPLFSLEAFLFDFHGDLYGKEVEISFLSFLREDQKFDSLEALAQQLQRDEEATRCYFQSHLA